MNIKLLYKIPVMVSVAFFSANLKSQINQDKELSKPFFQEFTKKINDSIPSIGSFIVSKNGNVVYEQYFHGASKETIFDVKSVTKSVTSILAGIARDKGILPDLKTPVLKILPEYDIPRDKFKNISKLREKRKMIPSEKRLH